MKKDKHLYLRKRRGRKPGKAGSSLALVMMIGAALVIWVMCIMPLMTTTGTTAIQTEEKYDDYLESRSSIEYCKSELENIVKSEVPYSFAVITDDTNGGKFKALRRNKEGTGSFNDDPGGYGDYVSLDPTDRDNADKDEPKDSDDGNKVTAICVVKWNPEKNHYDITIKTYHNGEPGQTYSLIYTLNGSLLIYPESYKQSQALPLSDFVVVDGIMGGKKEGDSIVPNEIWKSTITMSSAVVDKGSNKTGTGNFTEELLPFVDSAAAGYADSLEYPAVFKKTVTAAVDNSTPISDKIITEDPITSGSWDKPNPVEAGKEINTGDMWIKPVNNSIHVYVLDSNKQTQDITADCTIYVNGKELKTVPNEKGTYGVTVDYTGTDLNILPASGLRMLDTVGDVTFDKQDEPGTCSIDKVVETNGEYTVTLKSNVNGLLYGYCTSPDATTCTWSSSPTFSGLYGNNTYYFYYCRPAGVDGSGVYHTDSDIQYAGMIFPKAFTNSLTDDQYLMLGLDGGKYYAMESDLSTTEFAAQSDFFVCNDSISNSLRWTAASNQDGTSTQWSFQNKDYLNMCGELGWDRGWCAVPNLDTGAQSPDGLFTVVCSENGAKVYRTVSAKGTITGKPYTKVGYLKISNNGATAKTTESIVYFLNLPASAPDPEKIAKPTKTYEASVITTSYKAGGTHIPNETITSAIKAAFSNAYDVEFKPENLYVNGKLINDANTPNSPLPVGAYYLTANITVTDEDGNTCNYCVALGNLIVEQAEQEVKPTVTAGITVLGEDERYDEKKVTVSVTFGDSTASSATAPDGNLSIGYKLIQNADGTKPENSVYHWFPATGNSYNFRLEYGTYLFAARKWGNSNYKYSESESESFPVVMKYVTLPENTEEAKKEFYPIYDKDGEEGEGNPQWRKLPPEILPSRVDLWFGVPVKNADTKWFETYGEAEQYREANRDNVDSGLYYGVTVKNTNYEEDILQISGDDVTYANGHGPSMMRGSSLYFMGQDYEKTIGTDESVKSVKYSMDTYGNDIYLTTDLLVLNHGFINSAASEGNTESSVNDSYHVYVYPYTTASNAPANVTPTNDTMLFAVNDIYVDDSLVFSAKTFYQIPKGTDIAALDATGAGSMECGYFGETIPDNVKYLFQQDVYPDLNLDIAYATDEQLAHILSSETIKWTKNGVLKTGSDSGYTNAAYAVCTYVDSIEGVVSRIANRVLLAAAKSENAHVLDVPYNLSFITRYLSIDADVVNQADPKVTFKVYNLGEDENFFTWLGNLTGTQIYISKTLQVDYERYTNIVSNGSTNGVSAQICRYDDGIGFDGVDLFSNPKAQPLVATYLTSEIDGYYHGTLATLVSNKIKTVDRYVTISAGENVQNGSLEVFNPGDIGLSIYANYVLIDSNVDKISYSSLAEANVTINSQESGYTTQEYMGLFQTHTADSYTGTIVYVKEALDIKCRIHTGFLQYDTITGQIDPGFYYIYATKDGTSLAYLAKNAGYLAGGPNNQNKPYKIPEDSLKDYAVYIDKDGNLSNAYIDTGIYSNTSTGLGGFSGGNVG